MTENIKYHPWDKDELVNYCDLHRKTQRASFHKSMVAQMVEYAGCPEDFPNPEEIIKGQEFYPMHGSMETLVDLARSQQT